MEINDTLDNIEKNDPMLSDTEVEVKDYTAAPLFAAPSKAETAAKPQKPQPETPQTEAPDKASKAEKADKAETHPPAASTPPPVFSVPSPTTKTANDEEASPLQDVLDYDATTDYSDTDVEPQFDILSGEKLGALLGGQSLSGIVISVYNQFLTPMVANMAVPIKNEIKELKDEHPDVFKFFREKNKAAQDALCFTETESQALSEVWDPILAEVGVGEVTPFQKALFTTGAIALSKGVAVYGLRKQSDEQFARLMEALGKNDQAA